jgi:hypothetical protein
MTLDEIITLLDRDRAAHTTSGPSDEDELRRLEHDLGQPLPAGLRTFLARVGGGIFYGRHEIFGAHRVMIHDIELVPSLRSIVQHVQRQKPAPPPGWLPFHRADGAWHLIDTAGGATVVSWPPGARHASFEAFLTQVVLPRPPAG